MATTGSDQGERTRSVAVVVLLASPWLALIFGLGVVGGTFPAWFLVGLAVAVLGACTALAGLARTMSTGR